MEGALATIAVIALVAIVVLLVFLIAVLIRVRIVLMVVEQDMKEISARAIPLLENIENISERVKHVTESVEEQFETIKYSINSVKAIAEDIVRFERRIQETIEEPVINTVGTFAAIFKGVQAFVTRLRA